MSFPIARHEAQRLDALARLKILDSEPTPGLERLVAVAKQVFDVPFVLITLLDEKRQWFKARCGLDTEETEREVAFCNYTIVQNEVLIIPDAHKDRRFRNNPLVVREPHFRFYAGAPLTVEPGIRLGSFCILDSVPRTLDGAQTAILAGLARVAVDEIWLEMLERRGFAAAGTLTDGLPSSARQDLDFDPVQPITGLQLRAARGLVNWSVRELASASGVSATTIKRLEASIGGHSVREPTRLALRRALEGAGAEFVIQVGSEPGVRPERGNA